MIFNNGIGNEFVLGVGINKGVYGLYFVDFCGNPQKIDNQHISFINLHSIAKVCCILLMSKKLKDSSYFNTLFRSYKRSKENEINLPPKSAGFDDKIIKFTPLTVVPKYYQNGESTFIKRGKFKGRYDDRPIRCLYKKSIIGCSNCSIKKCYCSNLPIIQSSLKNVINASDIELVGDGKTSLKRLNKNLMKKFNDESIKKHNIRTYLKLEPQQISNNSIINIKT